MGNIIDYVREYGVITFGERPFTVVDCLVLCQLSYLKFDGIVPGTQIRLPAMSLSQIKEHKKAEHLFADEKYEKVNRALFEAVCGSKRFGTMKLNYHINIVDVEKETQFSATTFFLRDENFVAYRGTDETFIGWKEDFNMAFLSPVPGQTLAVNYLNKVARLTEGKLVVCGHSKGGNLAVYASMKCDEATRIRIEDIYSMDGPGFPQRVLDNSNYDEIKEKIHKVIPHSSLVGMLLQSQEDYCVVESSNFGLLQHDPYSWMIKDNKFVSSKDIYISSMFMDEVINGWIASLSEEQLHIFTETLFGVIDATQASTRIELASEWKKSAIAFMNAAKEIDDDTKKMMKEIIKKLFHMLRDKKIQKQLRLNIHTALHEDSLFTTVVGNSSGKDRISADER